MDSSTVWHKHAIKTLSDGKKIKIDACISERIVMPSTMFMIRYLPLYIVSFHLVCFWYRKDVLCQEGIMLVWLGQFPFCCLLMLKKFLSLPNHSIRVCIKGKRINRRVGYGLEIPVEDIFYGNEKAIQWAKRTLDGVDGNIKKKLRDLK